MNDPATFPGAARTGLDDVWRSIDQITTKLASLHVYRLALPDASNWQWLRGPALVDGKAQCVACHLPQLVTEPPWILRAGADIGTDDVQPSRSSNGRYRAPTRSRTWA